MDKGAALAPIILFRDAPPMTRQAAGELATYIEKISGARPQIIEGDPAPVPAKAIWVGYQPRLKEIFPKVDFTFKHPEEILIAANENHLVIAGRDIWNPQHMEFTSGNYGVRNYGQQEYGTCNAIYTFLQDHLDVRWLWQGEIGEDIIKKEKIAFAPFEYRYHPAIRMRRYVIWWWDRPTQRGKLCHEWARLQRLTLDSSNLHDMPDGHAFMTWWERFGKTHPEYFALQPDGTRGYHPQLGPHSVKMCKSNPAVWDQWLRDVEKQLEENPTKTLFRGAVNDGNLSGYCTCENCRAWDVPEAEKRFLVWSGYSDTYVALSDRQVRFANQLARKLRERFPDKDYSVMMLAYGPSLPAPLKNKPDSNVIVIHCTNWFAEMGAKDPRSLVGATFSKEFADWGKTGANLWWRPNLPGGTGMYHGLPDVPFGRIAETLRYVVKHNGTGLAPALFWNFWPTQGPFYYVMAQLAWNPDQDGYAILDDYCRRGYGKAYDPMKAYWLFMEETRNTLADQKLAYWKIYDEAFFKRAYSLLDEADAAVAKEPEIYAKRLAHVRMGLDFTRLVSEAHALKERYKASQGQDAEVAAKLRETMTTIKSRIRGDTKYYMGPAYQLERWLNEPKELWQETK